LPQYELEVNNLKRKLKLLEDDLENAEDQAHSHSTKSSQYESELEEAKRENAQLKRTVDQLEGEEYFSLLALYYLAIFIT